MTDRTLPPLVIGQRYRVTLWHNGELVTRNMRLTDVGMAGCELHFGKVKAWRIYVEKMEEIPGKQGEFASDRNSK